MHHELVLIDQSEFRQRHRELHAAPRSVPETQPTPSQPTRLKPPRFDSPANTVGPWPSSLGCTPNSYSPINPTSPSAIGSFTPPPNTPLPDSRLSCPTASPRS